MKYYTHKDYKGKYAFIEKDNDGQSKYIDIKSSEIYIAWDNLMEEITFHEAFCNEVNKIVLDAITDQHKEVLWDSRSYSCLAVSDLQKKWILDNYVLKGKVAGQVMELTQKLINQQREYDQRFCDLHDTNKKALDKLSLSHNDNTWYIGELKKFIQHLQDYIAAKHLESEGLILEKFIQEGK